MIRSAPDRGTHNAVRFERCARGFVLVGGEERGMLGTMYAFDHIEDVAAWFVEQYRAMPEDGPQSPDEVST